MNQIINKDCLLALREMPDNSIDCCVTDPPAGIAFMNKKWDSDKGGRDEWIKWLCEIMIEVKRVLKPGAHGFVWALPRTSHWTAMALENAGCDNIEEKDSMKWNGGNDMVGLAGTYPDGTPRPKQISKNAHPTVKPLKLMSYLIVLGSRENDTILDPFAGSGTTLVAAKMLNRKYIGCELDPEYVKIAEARLSAVDKPNVVHQIKKESVEQNAFFG